MEPDCRYSEKPILGEDGNPIFASMGDIARATETFRKQPKNPKALDVLNAYRNFRLNCIRTSLSLLRKASPPDKVLISARLKRLTSILRKLRRGQKGAVNEMDDIIGFRIICQSYGDAVAMSSRIANNLNASVKNYLENDHGAGIGYRAQHGIVKFKQPFHNSSVTVRFEIQVRSWYQHLWACWCESHGEQAKEGFPNRANDDAATQDLVATLRECSHKIAQWEKANPSQVQTELLNFSDPYNIALAWINNKKMVYQFDVFGHDIASAVRHLNRLESQMGLDPLLLVGVANEPSLRELLMKTHPRFTKNKGDLNPKYWMPQAQPV